MEKMEIYVELKPHAQRRSHDREHSTVPEALDRVKWEHSSTALRESGGNFCKAAETGPGSMFLNEFSTRLTGLITWADPRCLSPAGQTASLLMMSEPSSNDRPRCLPQMEGTPDRPRIRGSLGAF
jgi:hypothetical protein